MGPLLTVALWAHAAPRGPQPTLRLKLADLGIPNPPQYLQEAGASMLSVHFVDNTHLLVTYSLRGLVERIPGDPPDDNDRAIAALLVELPSGKVLARDRWHLHDYSQYLWSLGNGRFLLRIRSTLTAIAPLANLASGDAFREMPFLHVPGSLDAIQIAPEGDMVTVEASPARKRPADRAEMDESQKQPKPPETLYFVRVTGTGAPDSPIRAVSAGNALVRGIGLVPMNGRGYLFARSGKRSRWTLQFDGFDGQMRDLSYVDSSCIPRLQFVSPSQFLVFSCRGSDDKTMLSAYDFSPQEMWEEPLSSVNPLVQFAYAQQSGRFAISRTVLVSSAPSIARPGPLATPVADSVTGQEVRVYQMESGDLLVKLIAAPVSANGQNFDLAADGLSVLVVRDATIEVYRLPPPSAKDKKELAEAQRYEPSLQPETSRVQLRHLLREVVEAETKAAQQESTQPSAKQPVAPLAAAPPIDKPVPSANTPANSGDVDTPRKPPSLLNPGESPDNGKKPQI